MRGWRVRGFRRHRVGREDGRTGSYIYNITAHPPVCALPFADDVPSLTEIEPTDLALKSWTWAEAETPFERDGRGRKVSLGGDGGARDGSVLGPCASN